MAHSRHHTRCQLHQQERTELRANRKTRADSTDARPFPAKKRGECVKGKGRKWKTKPFEGSGCGGSVGSWRATHAGGTTTKASAWGRATMGARAGDGAGCKSSACRREIRPHKQQVRPGLLRRIGLPCAQIGILRFGPSAPTRAERPVLPEDTGVHAGWAHCYRMRASSRAPH